MPEAAVVVRLAKYLPFGEPGRSIRARLTLWYVSLLAVVLVGFSVGVYIFLLASFSFEVNGITNAYQKLLTDEASQAPGNLRTLKLSEGSNLIGQPAVDYQSRNDIGGPHIHSGPPLYASTITDNEAALLDPKRQGCHPIDQNHFSCTWLVYPRNRTRLTQAQGAVTFQASRSSVAHAENQLLTALIVGIPVSLLIALGGGWIFASRALSPLEELRRTTQSITATDLSRRIGINRDDELGRLAQTIDGMIERLDSAFKEQRRLTADVSHELRTPLSVIQAQTTLALKRDRSGKEYVTVLASIQEETERMSRIVEDLLLLARAEAGQEVIERDPVRLDVMARWAGEHCMAMAEEKQVELVLALRPVMIDGDAGRIRQMALNLVHNAVKYTEPGGRVRVRVASKNGVASLEVHDTGVGIDERSLPHIFERFYMVDRSRSKAEGGSGLGLAIVHWIVEAHEGTIAVESTSGTGTVFTVRIPMHAFEQPRPPVTIEPKSKRGAAGVAVKSSS
jgi:heavy metal sensor kinase